MSLSRSTLLQQTSSLAFGTGTFTTSSFTPPANCLLVISVGAESNAGTNVNVGTDLTLSGGGLTYTSRGLINLTPYWSCGERVWTAPVGASPSSMSLDIDCGADNIYLYKVNVVAYTGYKVSDPVGAIGTNAAFPTAGAASLTLNASPLATSEVIASAFVNHASASSAITPDAAWTEVYENPGDYCTLQTQIRTGSTSTSVDWSDVSVTGSAYKGGAIAIEIKAETAVEETITEGAEAGDSQAADAVAVATRSEPATAGASFTADVVAAGSISEAAEADASFAAVARAAAAVTEGAIAGDEYLANDFATIEFGAIADAGFAAQARAAGTVTEGAEAGDAFEGSAAGEITEAAAAGSSFAAVARAAAARAEGAEAGDHYAPTPLPPEPGDPVLAPKFMGYPNVRRQWVGQKPKKEKKKKQGEPVEAPEPAIEARRGDGIRRYGTGIDATPAVIIPEQTPAPDTPQPALAPPTPAAIPAGAAPNDRTGRHSGRPGSGETPPQAPAFDPAPLHAEIATLRADLERANAAIDRAAGLAVRVQRLSDQLDAAHDRAARDRLTNTRAVESLEKRITQLQAAMMALSLLE